MWTVMEVRSLPLSNRAVCVNVYWLYPVMSLIHEVWARVAGGQRNKIVALDIEFKIFGRKCDALNKY